jgi:hypothetical protein
MRAGSAGAAAAGGAGASLPIVSEYARRSASVISRAIAVITGLARRPARNRNSCVIA